MSCSRNGCKRGLISPRICVATIEGIGTLLSCCQGLIVVDKKASTIRLIHFTLQEYIKAHAKLPSTAHSIIAETCLSYLNSQQVKAHSTSPSPDPLSTPFLKYSSVYWGVHAKRDLSDCAKLLVLRLFDDCYNQIPTKILLEGQEYYSDNGHANVMEILLARDDINPDKPGMHGQTPLCSAA